MTTGVQRFRQEVEALPRRIATKDQAATAEALLARGVPPPIWTSANVPGGEAANLELLRRYAPRVPPL